MRQKALTGEQKPTGAQKPQEVPVVTQKSSEAQKPQEVPVVSRKPSEVQKPQEVPAVSRKTAAVPLSKLSEFFPDGERWAERWEGETEGNFKERTVKLRAKWISRFARTMKVGTAKQKKALQFYQELIKLGEPSQPYRDPLPKVEMRALDIGVLLNFPDQDHLAWRWKGESDEQWEDRLTEGYLDWYRYIDSVKGSKKQQ
jgi:hypothetical protein